MKTISKKKSNPKENFENEKGTTKDWEVEEESPSSPPPTTKYWYGHLGEHVSAGGAQKCRRTLKLHLSSRIRVSCATVVPRKEERCGK